MPIDTNHHEIEQHGATQANFKCPKCGASDTQSIQMIVKSGTTHTQSTGIGFTGDGDIGVASFGGTNKSELAKQFEPGSDPSGERGAVGIVAWVLIGIGLIEIFACVIAGLSYLSFFGVLFLLAGWYVFLRAPSSEENAKASAVWQQKMDIFNNGWFCHRCGTSWKPNQ